MVRTWRSWAVRLLTAGAIVIALTAGAVGCAGPGPVAEEAEAWPPFNVGYRLLDLTCGEGAEGKTVTVAVWYPTASPPQPYTYGGPTCGSLTVDAPPLAGQGPYPLLVFSHGYGGSGLGAVFLTERLAAWGWIVAAPDHNDSHVAARIRSGQLKDFDRRALLREAQEIGASGPADRHKYLYRLEEMRLVIDRMVESEDFREIIDGDRIAVGGHSFGGYTALGLCGTIEERHDSRIRAVLLFSTGAGGYLFHEEELAKVQIPSMLFIGERERNQRRGTETMKGLADKVFRNLPPPKYLLEVRDASHFSFNVGLADNLGTTLLSGTAMHFEVIRRYSIAFLERHVAANTDFDHVLAHGHAMLTDYVREP